MTTVNQLSTLGSLVSSDKLLVYSSENGDSRKTSLATLLEFIESQFADPIYTTVITAPTSSGFNIAMPAYTTNVWEIINPTGTFAAGSLTLPAPADCFEGQQVIVCTTQIITAFTLNGNGSTLVGVPTSLGAGAFFTIRFNAFQSVWYCTSQNIVSTYTNLTITGSLNDANGNELVKMASTASAVNELTVTNAATGNAPSIAATGNDPNISWNLVSKGTGDVQINGVPALKSAAAGIQTFLTTPSSANLRAAITDETGLGGSLVFSSAANLFQPNLDDPLINAKTVALLPGPFVQIGVRSTVIDSVATVTAGIGATVVGGGANVVPVMWNGVNWIIC